MSILYSSWPWYIAGPVIGIAVPVLLLLENKHLGISSTLRQICAACFPGGVPLFNYDWKKESWNLFFIGGVLIGGWVGGFVLANPEPVALAQGTVNYFHSAGIHDLSGLMPQELFNASSLLSLKGMLLMIAGGFLVGFGTRYAAGCTSGHGILGLSALQWPSLVATCCFFIGGIAFSHFVLPFILAL